MTRLSFFIHFLVTFSSFLVPINCYGYLSLPKRQSAFFIFGDSLFDAGNNNYINTTTEYQANFWPYGEAFFHHPTGRFSDGRLITDFIAEYAKLPLIPTFLPFNGRGEFTYGVNFASVGSGALVETNKGYAIDLKTQLKYFKIVEKRLKQKLGEPVAKALLSKAVYLFSVGGSDYVVLLSRNSSVLQSSYSRKQYVGMVIGNLTTTIKEIYNKGGRKFGFVNMLPLGCLPGMKVFFPRINGSCVGGVQQEIVNLHNKALAKVLHELESQLKGFRYANHDFYTSLSRRVNDPSKSGFKNATACCGTGPYRGIMSCGGKRAVKEFELCENPSEYLFFDSDHPSEEANKQIAELIWNGTPKITAPYNLKMLFKHI